jgi:hypothetical protein
VRSNPPYPPGVGTPRWKTGPQRWRVGSPAHVRYAPALGVRTFAAYLVPPRGLTRPIDGCSPVWRCNFGRNCNQFLGDSFAGQFRRGALRSLVAGSSAGATSGATNSCDQLAGAGHREVVICRHRGDVNREPEERRSVENKSTHFNPLRDAACPRRARAAKRLRPCEAQNPRPFRCSRGPDAA